MPSTVLTNVGQTPVPIHTGPEMYVEACIQPLGGTIRLTTDGQTPTDSLGLQIYAGSDHWLEGSYEIKRAQIRTIGTDTATVSVTLEWSRKRNRKS